MRLDKQIEICYSGDIMKKIVLTLDNDLFKEVETEANSKSEIYPEGLPIEDLIRDWVEDRIIKLNDY